MIIRKALFAVLAALMFVAPAFAMAADQDFTIVNKSGYTIKHLYVSPVSSDRWGEDVLGKDVLEDGDSTDITFDKDEDVCKWDIKVVFADNTSAKGTYDLCATSTITVH